ncbi:hypothetical protein KC360_g3607 [Hortaea werneckii]|nr:hypothetical protein KC325_g8395 [Hortaea werneckii]KAI6995031.1 hypothetical protein KC359_g4330 [Hortaea werneckii]KAI7147024.1 hypothetical protein KC344_g3096 [Hortaea werneckii]KAI7175582.1 hypothetical protein KC360_g3607 [Hortaea werneckii]KAI7507810.1 hypothetical protein KC347_g6609 [Hortaea werneckii]
MDQQGPCAHTPEGKNMVVANLISSSVALAIGRPGAKYHIGYPVLARSAFGMYGHFFFVWVRAVVAIIWFGVQSYFGSQLLNVLLRCVFGSSWWDMTNHLPDSAGITSRNLLAFFLFWMIEMPFCAVHPSKIKMLFALESVQPDFTRYTRRPKDAGWRQASSIFASKTLIFFFGIAATASAQTKFGEAYWNQWDLLNAILDRFWSPAARAGCFFASFGFVLSVLGVNIGCNAIPFGADVTGLLPKAFTIVRGQLFCGIVSLAIVPWKLTTDGSAFLKFLGSYNIFISPICAVIITDYFFVRRGNIHTPSLFDPQPRTLYYYTKGWNLKAAGSWVAGVVLGLPGLIGSYHSEWVAAAATHMYQTGWLLCFAMTATMYCTINLVARTDVLPNDQGVNRLKFEALAASDGYMQGDCVVAFQHEDGTVIEGTEEHQLPSLDVGPPRKIWQV